MEPQQSERPQNTPPNAAPVISDAEMKMPEEDFGAAAPETEHSKTLLFTLIGILAVLLVILAGIIMWGDTLMTMVNDDGPSETDAPPINDLQPEPAAQTQPTTAEEIETIEEELEDTDFEEFESELEAIEAEFESEAEASAQ